MEIQRQTIGDATLYLANCLEVLPTLHQVIDCVVTDPPYGVNFSGKKTKNTKKGPVTEIEAELAMRQAFSDFAAYIIQMHAAEAVAAGLAAAGISPEQLEIIQDQARRRLLEIED